MRLGTPPRPPTPRPATVPVPAPARRRILWPWVAAALALPLAAAWVVLERRASEPVEIAPRHRAEALCFALAAPPPYAPPMRVAPSAALVRGRFGVSTPAAYALRSAMRFEDSMVLRESTRRVGDFDVSVLWLRLPGRTTDEHWLVVGWMEGADLAVCSFRFEGSARTLSPQQIAWGEHLLARVLVRSNFAAGALPPVRLRVVDGRTMPSFGPAPVARAASATR